MAKIDRLEVMRSFYYSKNLSAIARKFNISRSALNKWRKQVRTEGKLRYKKRGRPKTTPSKITKEQVTELRCIIESKMPGDFSLNYPAWSNKVVRKLIFQKYNIVISLRSVTRLLVNLEFLPVKCDYSWLNAKCGHISNSGYEGLTLNEYAKSKKAMACLLLLRKSFQKDIITICLITARGHIDFCCVRRDEAPPHGIFHTYSDSKIGHFYYWHKRDFIYYFLEILKRSKRKKLIVGHVKSNLRQYICSDLNFCGSPFFNGIMLMTLPYHVYKGNAFFSSLR